MARYLNDIRWSVPTSVAPGSVRGVMLDEPGAGNPLAGVGEGGAPPRHGEPKRAQSWKRRTQPRGYLQRAWHILYSEVLVLEDEGLVRVKGIDILRLTDGAKGHRPHVA